MAPGAKKQQDAEGTAKLKGKDEDPEIQAFRMLEYQQPAITVNVQAAAQAEPVECETQARIFRLKQYVQPAANLLELHEADLWQAAMHYHIRAVMDYDPISYDIKIGPEDGLGMVQVLDLVTEAKTSAATEEFKTGIGIMVHRQDDYLSSDPAHYIDNIYPMGQSFLMVSNFDESKAKVPEQKCADDPDMIEIITSDGYRMCIDAATACDPYAGQDQSDFGSKTHPLTPADRAQIPCKDGKTLIKLIATFQLVDDSGKSLSGAQLTLYNEFMAFRGEGRTSGGDPDFMDLLERMAAMGLNDLMNSLMAADNPALAGGTDFDAFKDTMLEAAKDLVKGVK
jgi:hypothetical protein